MPFFQKNFRENVKTRSAAAHSKFAEPIRAQLQAANNLCKPKLHAFGTLPLPTIGAAPSLPCRTVASRARNPLAAMLQCQSNCNFRRGSGGPGVAGGIENGLISQ